MFGARIRLLRKSSSDDPSLVPEVTYESLSGSLVIDLLLLSLISFRGRVSADRQIVIPAGTPEDHELQTISNEQDAQKKLAMYRGFRAEVFGESSSRGLWKLADLAGLPGDRRLE